MSKALFVLAAFRPVGEPAVLPFYQLQPPTFAGLPPTTNVGGFLVCVLITIRLSSMGRAML
jgi:hypothetical protein